MIQYRKTWQNTARIARIIDNMAVCRAFLRAALSIVYRPGPIPVVSRSSVGGWKWHYAEQLFHLPDMVRKPRRHRR